MFSRTITLTSAIAVAAAVCFLGTAPAYAASKKVSGAEFEALKAQVEQNTADVAAVLEAFPPKRVFVTSEIFTGDLGAELDALTSGARVATGIAAGDEICQELAEKAELSGEYKAWLGGTDVADTPLERFVHSPVEYVDTTGAVFAESWEDLVGGNILVPLNVDEYQITVPGLGDGPANGYVFTSVSAEGGVNERTHTHFAPIFERVATDCLGWTFGGGDDPTGPDHRGPHLGVWGESFSTDGDWTSAFSGDCSGNSGDGAHLYCFEQ